MKKALWSLILKVFASELNSEKKSYYKKRQMEEKRAATKMNYRLGTKVISRSNEPNDLLIGTVCEHIDLGEDREILLVIQCEKTGRQFSSLDNRPHLWSEEKEAALKKLNWAEQWNAMMHGHYLIDPEHKQRREEAWAEENPSDLTKNV